MLRDSFCVRNGEGDLFGSWRRSPEVRLSSRRIANVLECQRVAAYEILEQTVALAYGVPGSALRARTRGKAGVAFARQVAMYLAHVAYGQSLTDVGILFGRDRTTVAHACGVIEERRDDPVFDRSMDQLEFALYRFAAASIALAPAMTRAEGRR